MKSLLRLLFIGLAGLAQGQASPYADAIVSYQPGVLPGNLKSFTNTAAVLGEPSRETPGAWGGPVEPFNPPYLNSQLVSVGEGGEITVRFDRPIEDLPANPYGLDFIVFGNAGFVITNGNYAGGGVTDGSLLGSAQPNSVKVWVSSDNARYYVLNSALAPVVDGYYPTDGLGFFNLPVDPALGGSDFSGKDLKEIRRLYAGSAGGTGLDLAWAVDDQGQPAGLGAVQYLRLEVLAGHIDIDGFAQVGAVPEPGCWALFLLGGASLAAWGKRR